jgi:sugar phosphate isomerase/epimerase
MKKINRREFIGKSALGAGAALALSQFPTLLKSQVPSQFKDHPLGFQSWMIRDLISKDFSGTLKMVAGLGYQQVEMCSPKGYASLGFGSLVNMPTTDLKNIINDAGLTCPSCHFGFPELRDDIDDRIQFAKDLGLKVMVCSTFWLPKTATLKDYLDAADTLNKSAEKINAAGMQAAFHNHDFEFATLDGQLIYDALMKEFDPKLVKMQFQTEVINLGYKASTYFNKYPGRFISSHLSDWTTDKKEVPVGQGVIDWKEFFAAAKAGGVEYFYVEMDMKTFKDSAQYVHKLLNTA